MNAIHSTASSCCCWKYRHNYPVYNILHNAEPYWKKPPLSSISWDAEKTLMMLFCLLFLWWHHLRSGLQELWLLLNDNYRGSWGASIFYNLVVVSTFLCKGSRDSTHTHTQVESGGRTAHTDLILSDKTLWGVQRERGRWRERGREGERERERDMEKEGWERRFRGLFCQPRL